MFKPLKIKKRIIMHPDDYWMLIKEDGKVLWYLSKSKDIDKKLLLDAYQIKTKRLKIKPGELEQFDIEKLWDEKFGAYTRKYGHHTGRNEFRTPKKYKGKVEL